MTPVAEQIDRTNAALLIMDYQTQILSSLDDEARERAIAAVNQVIGAARGADVPVIFVAVQYRSGYPDANSANKRVSLLASRGMLEEGTDGVEIDPRIDSEDSDPVVIKRRVSALAHTDLQPLLRSLGVTRLFLAGVSTTGVVTSTVRAAADEDFGIVVVQDACGDANDRAHEVLMADVFPLQAEVVSADDVVAAFS